MQGRLGQIRVVEHAAEFASLRIALGEQLPESDRVGVFDPAHAIEYHQAVVDAVEHCLQTLVPLVQGFDVGRLVLAQRLGHQAEAADQRGHLRHGGNRQGDVEVALADLVRRLRHGLDGRAEAAGEAVRGDETDQQDGDADDAQQPRAQPGAVA
ncbi:hypothetical protein D3C81_1363900 [compost metagenome]